MLNWRGFKWIIVRCLPVFKKECGTSSLLRQQISVELFLALQCSSALTLPLVLCAIILSKVNVLDLKNAIVRAESVVHKSLLYRCVYVYLNVKICCSAYYFNIDTIVEYLNNVWIKINISQISSIFSYHWLTYQRKFKTFKALFN